MMMMMMMMRNFRSESLVLVNRVLAAGWLPTSAIRHKLYWSQYNDNDHNDITTNHSCKKRKK